MNSAPARAPHPALAFAIDLVLVLVFLAIGRATHAEPVFDPGSLASAWPFAIGLLIGWAVILLTRTPAAGIPAGAIAWLATLVIGMVLRVAAGGTAAVAFVIVAAITLAVLLIGWRLIARLVRRVRRA